SKGGEIDAQVADMEQALRDAGLPTGPPASGHYRQGLENAVRRGMSIDTITKLAADHHITPEDFKVLDGMEEIREDEDGDGIYKSVLPDAVRHQRGQRRRRPNDRLRPDGVRLRGAAAHHRSATGELLELRRRCGIRARQQGGW
ncbi:hypothetical protein, partial [Paractinoplanes rishiriensis]|uniref:hypothetical protein n=1 Tax=Paractinoplanes rishiriensis TaxID=1050105 RepID=UPI00194260C0